MAGYCPTHRTSEAHRSVRSFNPRPILGEKLIWWLFAGTRGGPMRAGIVVLLSQGPLNANQIAQRMGIDYKTVRHHLNVLVKNKAVVMWGERYGLLYFISDHLRESYPIFQRVRGKVEQPNAKGVWWEVE